jgi:hypothetical protein
MTAVLTLLITAVLSFLVARWVTKRALRKLR